MKKETNKNIIKFIKIFSLLCFLFFSFSFQDIYAGSYIGPTGITFTDGQNTTSGGGVLYDVTFVSNVGVVICTALNGSVLGAVSVSNGNTYGIVDNFGGSGASTGDYISDGNWLVFKQTSGVGCVIPPSGDNIIYGQFTIVNGMFEVTEQTTRINLVSPENYATTTATSTTLEIEYYINSQDYSDLDELYIDIDIMNPLLVSGTMGIILDLTENIQYDTLVSTSTTINLPNNQNYQWNANLRTKVTSEDCNNPLLSIIFCAFQQATQQSIANSGTWYFTIGNNPLGSIEDFGQSVFNASGVDQNNLYGGGCYFVATSTCDGLSPSTYQGCILNALSAGFCPSTNTINYATSTLFNSLNGKIPFGFYTQISQKIGAITSGTSTVQGNDIVVHIDSLGSASTTIFSWSDAKNFMDNVIGEDIINLLIFIEWIAFSGYCLIRINQIL